MVVDTGSSSADSFQGDTGHGTTFKVRFIPACAGNIYCLHYCYFEVTVHPRVCGEHIAGCGFLKSSSGSSPRVRGTLNSRRCRGQSGRFIPACAGNIHISDRLIIINTVHPRVCGEHPRLKTCMAPAYGSSPRVRGTLSGLKRSL